MTNNQSFLTYATLKDATPFDEIFPDKKVPIISLVPKIPQIDAPPCYVLDTTSLNVKQIKKLAKLLCQTWKECTSLKMATQYIETGLPIRCDWFSGVTTTDFGHYMSLVD